MTNMLMESFDLGLTTSNLANKWNKRNVFSLSTGAARTGGVAARCDGSGDTGRRRVEAADEHVTFILGMAVRGGGLSTNTVFFQLWTNGATQNQIVIRSGASDSTKIEAVTSGGVTVATSASGVLTSAGVYQYIEAKVTHSNSGAGAVVIRVDEVEVCNVSGVTTTGVFGASAWDGFGISNNTSYEIDDFYANNGAGSVNNDFEGAVRIWRDRPKGNGASSGMTNDAGNSTNNYSHVDDTTSAPDTSDYVEGGSGAKDTYDFYELTNASYFSPGPAAGDSVRAVAVYAWAQKSDAGARNLDGIARSSGGTETNITMTPALVNGVYGLHWAIFEANPAGGPWTVADLDASGAEFGIAGS